MNELKDFDVDRVVKERYAKGAEDRQADLCCPVDYDPSLLKILPAEILEKDYGCGDPSRYLRKGESVLDLGSGGGKICYLASQIVGAEGHVIGVDFNPAMLQLARKYQSEMADKIGYSNVQFKRGKIQDLKTDLESAEQLLENNPVSSTDGWIEFEEEVEKLRSEKPLVQDDSVDVVVSNCVLNLVRSEDKRQLFREMYRVLRKGGRAVISDIVSDEEVPESLQRDPELWSGCISGAFQEKAFLKAFEDAGFYGVNIDKRDEKPWKTVEGIEFRSVTVIAYKGKAGPCWERYQAVIYKGPWKQVVDDDGHVLERGARMAVCDKTFQIYTKEPYGSDIIAVTPLSEMPSDSKIPYDCKAGEERDPRETKGRDYKKTDLSAQTDCCTDGGCC